MNKDAILNRTKEFIVKEFSGEGTGHDYYHIERVVKVAKRLAEEEDADVFLVELAAWLHDLGDYKLNEGVDRSAELITGFLLLENVDSETIHKVMEIVSQVSFSKGNTPTSLEAKIVQDADRLDALGAIGIARCFAYGGSKQREIYNPENPDETSVQHFYDKLLKLKDLINTSSARKLAKERHQFLENFLEQFYAEWKGE
jgi:uncharacterized protein